MYLIGSVKLTIRIPAARKQGNTLGIKKAGAQRASAFFVDIAGLNAR
jgi:hypothetical protein